MWEHKKQWRVESKEWRVESVKKKFSKLNYEEL